MADATCGRRAEPMRAMMLIWASILVLGIVYFTVLGLTHG